VKLHTGITFDEHGRPAGSLLTDNIPAHGRRSGGNGRTPTFRGTLVVGRSGATPASEASREAMKRRWAERDR